MVVRVCSLASEFHHLTNLDDQIIALWKQGSTVRDVNGSMGRFITLPIVNPILG